MESDTYQASRRQQPALDYWDVAEVALLLRLVSLIISGGAVVVCVWLAVMALRDAGPKPFVSGPAAQTKPNCKCELLLVPIPPRSRQIVDAQALTRT
jgi:hypothetical protein